MPIVQDALDRGIEAHGGLATWQSYQLLEYQMGAGENSERHVVDLWSRKTLQAGENWQVGYNGTDVWVAPNLEAFDGNPRFYNGLHFYFFGLPFVLADPGANREDLGSVTINSESFDAVKISFDAGVGESPNDYYIVHFDPQTHRMRYLLYTATYFSGEPSERFNAREYETWQEVDGLLVPEKITTYRWNSESRELGDKRGESNFSNVKFFKPGEGDERVFELPQNAEVAAAGGE